MANAKVYYLLDEEGRKASLLQAGNGKYVQCVEPILDTAILHRCKVDHGGDAVAFIGYDPDGSKDQTPVWNGGVVCGYEFREEFNYTGPAKLNIVEKKEHYKFSTPMTVDQLLQWEGQERDRLKRLLASMKEQLPSLQHQKEVEWAIGQEKEQKNKADRAAEFAKRQAETEAKEKEMAALADVKSIEMKVWITKHGSSRLKLALEMGMLDTIATVYREERLKVDYGEKWQFDKTATIPILNPSEANLLALKEARQKHPDVTLECIKIKAWDEEDGGHTVIPCLCACVEDRLALCILD